MATQTTCFLAYAALACLPLSAGRVLPSDYFLAKRASLIEHVWGYDQDLPSRSTPDEINPTNVSGVTEIVWTLGAPGRGAPNLSSKVYQILRSGDAQAAGSRGTRKGTAPRAKRAFLLHHGHSQAPEANGTWWDHYNMSGFLSEIGDADVFIHSMPLFGCNRVAGVPSSHSWFQQFETPGNSPKVNSSSTLRFFLEPVVLTTNMAFRLGYEEVVITGKSGGGWTTTLVAALDPRLKLSIPDAGSIPLEFNHTSWDYEQEPAAGPAAFYSICDYKCMYILAGLERGRVSIQLLHERDPCCFHGLGRHPQILSYNTAVQQVLTSRQNTPEGGAGWFSTAVVDWDKHEYSPRDRRVITDVVNAFFAGKPATTYDHLRCDILRAKNVTCGV